MNTRRSAIIVAAKHATIIMLFTGFLFVVIEGLSSTAMVVYQMLPKPGSGFIAARYDEGLGWVNLSSAYVPDIFGAGKYVRTNERGFRSDTETEVAIPDGMLRIVCSGDSFTYGEGVANNHTWCHLLSELDSRFETVNMGQAGYGVDQMYLRYLRDGMPLEHSIHIFAFIQGDLSRMARRDHHGHGKPVLKLSNGALETANVPVPRFRWWMRRTVNRADFRAVDFVQRVLARLGLVRHREPVLIATAGPVGTVGPLAAKVFQTLQQMAHEENVLQVFVYLPTERDLGLNSDWRRWAITTMDTLDLTFIDLTLDLRSLPAGRVGTFFIPRSMEAAGHYTEEGNAWVAEVLHDRLLEIPEIRTRLTTTLPQGN